jgi:hypothetical protein
MRRSTLALALIVGATLVVLAGIAVFRVEAPRRQVNTEKRAPVPKSEMPVSAGRPRANVGARVGNAGPLPVGEWVNPKTETSLIIKANGWEEKPNNLGPPVSGVCERSPDGSLTLFHPNAPKAFVIRGGESVIACQELTLNGALVEDGLVRFKKGYDWQGRQAMALPFQAQREQPLSGRWAHPNSEIEYEATNNGQWIEHRTIGGVAAQGKWKQLNDGSFVAELTDGQKRRIWKIEQQLLGVVPIQANGAMAGDGTVAKLK